jgi:hypothetical protein
MVQRNHKPKPVIQEKRGIVSKPRVPHDEPLTPGLRKAETQDAIGFVHEFNVTDTDDGDWDE